MWRHWTILSAAQPPHWQWQYVNVVNLRVDIYQRRIPKASTTTAHDDGGTTTNQDDWFYNLPA